MKKEEYNGNRKVVFLAFLLRILKSTQSQDLIKDIKNYYGNEFPVIIVKT